MDSGKFEARILIVDDELAVCEMLEERLRNEGYDCRIRSSAEGALDLIRKEAFDVVLSDLHMPGMSGLELLQGVRQECPRAAFVLLTGEQDVRTGIEAMKQGASDYVTKPFQFGSVVRSVAQGIEKKRLEREVEMYRVSLEKMVEMRTEQLQSALRRVEETYDSTLEALGAALDLRDAATEGHSARVTRYALMIAQALGCSRDQLREIARGAYLHDIGKMSVPDGILLKQGKLTIEEQQVMASHVMTGYHMVKRIPFLAEAAQIILTHQERYDGLGYPSGLKGSDIPLGARIFAVADTLDAMTSDRPYRKAMPLRVAIEEIRREAGQQFDPEIVRVFLAIPEASWIEVPTDHINPAKRLPVKSPLDLSNPAPPTQPYGPEEESRDGKRKGRITESRIIQ
ncbi:MAG: HD-GYP domain-containing protein [Terriglobia bacterium]